MKVDTFVGWVKIVNESGGDLSIGVQGILISVIERQREALKNMQSFLYENSVLHTIASEALNMELWT